MTQRQEKESPGEHPAESAGERFLRHANHPRNQEELARPTGRARGVGQCGDWMVVEIAARDDRITEISAFPQGCMYTVVCASAMSELVRGQTIEQALKLEPEDVEKVLGGLPRDHLHCARLAVNTLGEAIEDRLKKSSAGAG